MFKKEKNQNIQVYVRCRPINAFEKKQNASTVVDVSQNNKDVIIKERIGCNDLTKKFTFDRVFGPEATQVDIYKTVVGNLIDEVLTGYNCTVFAYGQTGTGKTHTMQGIKSSEDVSWEKDPQSGIIPRTLHHLFESLSDLEVEYNVRVSFIELYNEELFDLLSPINDMSKLRLFEDATKKGSVVIQGLAEAMVRNKDEVYTILERGAERRRMASTLMNDTSSRSHTVFSVTVHIKENTLDGEDLVKIGKLNLVDLAGSECIGRSGAVERRAREAGSINQSLLTLGRVITALVEKAPHVPYRESKLTRLLQDSLGGRTKTSIIATISPASCNAEETLSTLDYAHRAKNITNKPEVNQKLTKKTLIKEYSEEIERLRRDLIATRDKNGIFVDEDNYKSMESCIAAQLVDIKEKESDLEALREQLEQLTVTFNFNQAALATKEIELENTNKNLAETNKNLDSTKTVLKTVQINCEEQKFLVSHRVKTEAKLTEQANKLLSVANESTEAASKLRSKVDLKREIDLENETKFSAFRDSFRNKVTGMEETISRMFDDQAQYMNGFIQDLEANKVRCQEKCALQMSQFESSRQMITKTNVLMRQMMADLEMKTNGQSENVALSIQKRLEEYIRVQNSFHAETLAGEFIKIQELTRFEASMFQNMQTLCQSKFESQRQFVSSGVEKLLANLSDLSAMIDTISEENVQRLNDIEAQKPALEAQRVEFLEEWRVKEKELMAWVANMNSFANRHDRVLNETLPKIWENAEIVISNEEEKTKCTQTQCALIGSDASELQTTLTENITNFSEFIQNEIKSGVTRNESVQLQTSAVISLLAENKATEQTALNRDAELFTTDVQHFTSLVAQNTNLTSESLNTFVTSVSTQLDVLQETKVAHDEIVAEYHNAAAEHVSDLTKMVQRWEPLLQESLTTQVDQVENFSNGIVKEIPTGATPDGKAYVYPHYLVATSPHERILNRLRRNLDSRVAVQTVIPGQASFDEEAVNNPPPVLRLHDADLLPPNGLPAGANLSNNLSSVTSNDPNSSMESIASIKSEVESIASIRSEVSSPQSVNGNGSDIETVKSSEVKENTSVMRPPTSKVGQRKLFPKATPGSGPKNGGRVLAEVNSTPTNTTKKSPTNISKKTTKK